MGEFKFFGVTMAAAILIDAAIVRGVLLPADLALLGDRAWWPGERRAIEPDRLVQEETDMNTTVRQCSDKNC